MTEKCKLNSLKVTLLRIVEFTTLLSLMVNTN